MANIIQTFPKGTGSGGGHTILDTDGTAVAQESNLQFTGLSVTDDSSNGITEVSGEGLNSDSIDDIAGASSIVPAVIIGDANNYSTNEKIVGKWIDGKPIYQKTFYSTVNKTNIKFNHGISSLDRLIGVETNFKATNSSTIWQMAGGSFMTGTPTGFSDAWNVYITNTQVCIDASSAGPGTGDMYITLRYTKTT